MNAKFFGVLFLAAAATAAPAAEAEADPSYLAGALPYHVAPALTNCKVENEILVTRSCVPKAEDVCTTETVETEEIKYEKACKDVEDTICDGPAGYASALPVAVVKREADPEADPQYFGGYGGYGLAPVAHVAPVAHAVAHTAVATVKHACRTVTTKHCVDNPTVIIVPVDVKHCHSVTKVECTDVENAIPKTTCEPVETTHVTNAGYGLGYAYGK